MTAKAGKRPALAPASRYEILAPTNRPGLELEDARLLPLDRIDHNPYQARQTFDAQALQELADSVREHGVIEPIIVRSVGERYEIVAGERRYHAAIIAEQENIPVRIMEMDTRQAALITALENLQREDLDIEDEARQFAHLCEVLEVSQRELARMLGKNPVYISRRTRLLKRPDLMEEYRAGRLTLHQAVAQAESFLDYVDQPNTKDHVDSAGITAESAAVTDAEVQLELIERADLHGFIVSRPSDADNLAARRSDSAGITSSGHRGTNAIGRKPLFRWRPMQQFYNWVGRTQVMDIPPDERASVRAQLTEIKEALEKQLAALDQISE